MFAEFSMYRGTTLDLELAQNLAAEYRSSVRRALDNLVEPLH
jgi:hypothetical protein